MAEPIIKANGEIEYKQHKPHNKWISPNCDSRSEILKYAGKIQALALANSLPDIKIKGDPNILDTFKAVIDRSGGLLLFNKLEQQISKGSALIGFRSAPYIDDDGNYNELGTMMFNAEPLMYIWHNGALIYLLVQVQALKYQSTDEFIICEEWYKDNTGMRYVAIKKAEYNDFLKSGTIPNKYDPNSLYDGKTARVWESRANYYRNIPYKLYVNNADCKGDIADVDEIYFKSLDAYKQMLPIDMLISRSFAFVNNSISKKLNIDDTMLTATENTIITNNSTTQFGGNGVLISQGTSQSDKIWTNITNTIRHIKELAFIRLQAHDVGKNNKQTAEIESLNAPADDMVEMKANNRENDHKDLVMNWKWYEKDEFNTNYGFKRSDVDVMVTGSTAWLQKQAKLDQANQDGYMNPQNSKNSPQTPENSDDTEE